MHTSSEKTQGRQNFGDVACIKMLFPRILVANWPWGPLCCLPVPPFVVPFFLCGPSPPLGLLGSSLSPQVRKFPADVWPQQSLVGLAPPQLSGGPAVSPLGRPPPLHVEEAIPTPKLSSPRLPCGLSTVALATCCGGGGGGGARAGWGWGARAMREARAGKRLWGCPQPWAEVTFQSWPAAFLTASRVA